MRLDATPSNSVPFGGPDAGEPVPVSPLCVLDLRKSLVVGILVLATGLAGCAPGVSKRSLGDSNSPADSAPAEVVVVEPEPEPEPSPEQVRAAEIRDQKRDIAQLRDQLETDRARADANSSRAEAQALEARESVRLLQSELAEIRVRTDAASAQADKAFALATEFLSSLVETRDEQRLIVERNLTNFNALDQRLSMVEGRVVETDQQRQAQLTQDNSRAAGVELKLQQTDEALVQMRSQLADLYREGEQTRAAIDSGPMLRMLRDLEATQRDTAVLRGLLEEMQSEQDEARERLRDYYLDLDARIQALQESQERERAAREAAEGAAPEDGFAPESSLTPDPAASEILQSGELDDEAGQLLESFEQELQRQTVDGQADVNGSAAVEAISGDTSVERPESAGQNALASPPVSGQVSDSSQTVPDIINTMDTVPVVSEPYVTNARSEGGERDIASTDAATPAEPSPVAAQGEIDTDRTAGPEPAVTGDSDAQHGMADIF
jgi:TolA binding protein trimerisation